MAELNQRTIDALLQQRSDIQTEWVRNLDATGSARGLKPGELEAQTSDFLGLVAEGCARSGAQNWVSGAWDETREFLEKISHSRALQGFDSQQTASFVFSLKPSIFRVLQRTLEDEPSVLTTQLTLMSELLDAMGLHTVATYQRSREAVIKRQQEELLELSTPVVKLWDGVLALPMIGTLDSQRTQVVMESLLQRIADTGSEIAIIDITGVPTVDTLVAQHLLKTVTAIRLMGADCIISGVRPQIAQTIVHLGLDLQGIVTKSSLADALALALHRSGLTVSKAR